MLMIVHISAYESNTKTGPSYCPCSIDLYDCNMTAGLEAKLCLAVGTRVMLRRNLDTKAGLVNSAIGTVLSIASNHVTVQFDHVSTPYYVEMVKSKFMVMKNFYDCKQFPLILAYAVTIHKCQGLSLDCAIVDLSDQVFSDGMAYVALSRVRTMEGLCTLCQTHLLWGPALHQVYISLHVR